jgi:hypothetical protein
VHVENRDKLKLIREADDTPEKNAIRSIARKKTVLNGADKRVRITTEELVVVI